VITRTKKRMKRELDGAEVIREEGGCEEHYCVCWRLGWGVVTRR